MSARSFAQLAGRLMRIPTAPGHEHAVRSEIEKICAENRLPFKRDQFGNVIVRLKTGGSQRPFVLAAHMDHPGFEVVRKKAGQPCLIRFQGGVAHSYFRPGIPVRLMPGSFRAKLTRRRGKERVFEITPDTSDSFDFAVWDLEPFAVRDGLIHGRACDDLVGSAAILATLIELRRRRAHVNVIGVISRAEEIGFQGALAVAASGALPKQSLIVSLETSKELPGVKMGNGVILRIGDKTSIFDSAAMRFLAEVAADLKGKEKSFQFQRGLMSGGTCEATAYQEFGYQTAAVCVALGNYHNCAPNHRIKAEYVSIADACGMVDLLTAAAIQMANYDKLISKLPNRLKKMARAASRTLCRTAN
jgi:putative aminopeptidase FrvX